MQRRSSPECQNVVRLGMLTLNCYCANALCQSAVLQGHAHAAKVKACFAWMQYRAAMPSDIAVHAASQIASPADQRGSVTAAVIGQNAWRRTVLMHPRLCVIPRCCLGRQQKSKSGNADDRCADPVQSGCQRRRRVFASCCLRAVRRLAGFGCASCNCGRTARHLSLTASEMRLHSCLQSLAQACRRTA